MIARITGASSPNFAAVCNFFSGNIRGHLPRDLTYNRTDLGVDRRCGERRERRKKTKHNGIGKKNNILSEIAVA